MTTPTAPAMPEPAFRLKWRTAGATYVVDKPNIDDTDCYTAEQLQAYAAQEVARERAKHIVKLERHEFEAAGLLRLFVRSIKPKKGRVFWALVSEASTLGSTCSAALAEWADMDPETGQHSARHA